MITDLELDELLKKVGNAELPKTHTKHFRTKIEFYAAMKEIGFLPYDPTMETNQEENSEENKNA